jgi:hypothetical protein
LIKSPPLLSVSKGIDDVIPFPSWTAGYHELWKNVKFGFVARRSLTTLLWGHGERSDIKAIESLGHLQETQQMSYLS